VDSVQQIRNELGDDVVDVIIELTMGGWKEDDICLFINRDMKKVVSLNDIFRVRGIYRLRPTVEAVRARKRFLAAWAVFRTSFTLQGNTFLSPASINRNLTI